MASLQSLRSITQKHSLDAQIAKFTAEKIDVGAVVGHPPAAFADSCPAFNY
jgi:hypothetical protein